MSALDDRRQRAREAGHDVVAQLRDPYAMIQPMEAAIETATRVRITDEALAEAYPWLLPSASGLAREHFARALRKLGFEVEE